MMLLRDIANAIQSKNAGAFDITFDVMFQDRAVFDAVRSSGVLNAALFARLYDVPESECDFVVYDVGQVFKCTLPRSVASGGIGDVDVYGAQQHTPLLDVEFDL